MVTSPIVCTARCTGQTAVASIPRLVLSGILVEQMIRSEAYRSTGVLLPAGRIYCGTSKRSSVVKGALQFYSIIAIESRKRGYMTMENNIGQFSKRQVRTPGRLDSGKLR
jgi:hypothetical protein